MKRTLLALFLLLSISSFAQTGGNINLNDFGLPFYPYKYSRFWERGSIPAGSNPIIDIWGRDAIRFYGDTMFVGKLALREDSNPYKLVWVDTGGMFKAITPPYLLPADTTNKWLGVGTVIPGSQVNSDWNSVSGVSQILNKPTIPAAQVNSDWSSVSGVSEILNKPILKRTETYLGTTDVSGNYTVVYGVAFSVTPDVQPQLQAGTPNQQVRIVSSTTTGFTINVTQRAVLSLLGLDLLAGTPTNLSGASVGVLVTER